MRFLEGSESLLRLLGFQRGEHQVSRVRDARERTYACGGERIMRERAPAPAQALVRAAALATCVPWSVCELRCTVLSAAR